MALFSECMLSCARNHLTPPTLSERRYYVNHELLWVLLTAIRKISTSIEPIALNTLFAARAVR